MSPEGRVNNLEEPLAGLVASGPDLFKQGVQIPALPSSLPRVHSKKKYPRDSNLIFA